MEEVTFRLRSFFVTLLFISAPAFANGAKSPPSFDYQNEKVIPIDMETVSVKYTFDVEANTAKATALVTFTTGESGFPMMDLVPDANLIKLDETEITPSDFPLIPEPQGHETKFRVLKKKVEPNVKHTLYFEYSLSDDAVTFGTDSVRVGFFMDDLTDTGRGFFENYGPANFEFDAVKYDFTVNVVGTDKEHEVFTNGALTSTGTNEWTIDFADYFTASSPYFHITDKGYFKSSTFTYDGVEKDFEVTIYGESQSLVKSGVTAAKKVLKELEATYGPFAHDRVVAYITPGGGGMEHCGATMTSLWALEHEFTHFWFARGVMPANGNSGWVDEAIASWRDDNYPRASGEPDRRPVNMSNYSPYKRNTDDKAYTEGAELISEFDYMFQDKGGMRTILKDLFTQQHHQTITYQFFKGFLEAAGSVDLTAIFNRYVLGKSSSIDFQPIGPTTLVSYQKKRSHHPRPYTKAELKLYR